MSLPKTSLPGLQVMEYLRAFYSGRLGLNPINGLVLISGAFGLFQTDAVREIDGYRRETVTTHRKLLFNREYGRVGTLVIPFFVAAEMFGPLIERLGYVVLPLAWYPGLLDVEFFLAFFLLTTGFGVFLSWFGVFSEVWSFNRYDSPWQVLRLLWYGVLENFG